MDHIAQIAGKLADHQLDAMLLASQAGERYAVGFHGEGLVLVTRGGGPLFHRQPLHRGGPAGGAGGLRWSW